MSSRKAGRHMSDRFISAPEVKEHHQNVIYIGKSAHLKTLGLQRGQSQQIRWVTGSALLKRVLYVLQYLHYSRLEVHKGLAAFEYIHHCR